MQEVFGGIQAALVQHRQTARIYFAPHSKFPGDLLAQNFRGLHLIRDPRDVVLSGLHYHKKSGEKWLHVRSEEYRGLTYQQKLNSLDPDDQIVLEMQRTARAAVREMTEWHYDDPRFFEARYEDLIEDASGEKFGRILAFLGLRGSVAVQGVAVFRQVSLFPGKPIPQNHSHIRSGRSGQWRTDFRRRHGERFVEILGDCLIRLGYEPDNDWVRRLPA